MIMIGQVTFNRYLIAYIKSPTLTNIIALVSWYIFKLYLLTLSEGWLKKFIDGIWTYRDETYQYYVEYSDNLSNYINIVVFVQEQKHHKCYLKKKGRNQYWDW